MIAERAESQTAADGGSFSFQLTLPAAEVPAAAAAAEEVAVGRGCFFESESVMRHQNKAFLNNTKASSPPPSSVLPLAFSCRILPKVVVGGAWWAELKFCLVQGLSSLPLRSRVGVR